METLTDTLSPRDGASVPPSSTTARSDRQPSRSRRPLSQLERPSHIFRHLGPNWYASIMGTGIVANAAATLEVRVTGLRAFATAVWIVDAFLLVALTAAWAIHWLVFTEHALGHGRDPATAQFYGAPPMAMLTVGTGTALLGGPILGQHLALASDWVLWTVGTVTGLLSAAVVPYRMFTRHQIRPGDTFATWMMPVVPPMVSAATGAVLIPHIATAQGRLDMLLACLAMFGLSAVAAVVMLTLVWSRLVYHKVGPAGMVPTLWIVLGPLGQSITAINLLRVAAHGALPAADATAMSVAALLYGIAVWGFAMLWMALAAAITLRTIRSGMPFALTWWSFTFPVGTVVTGTNALAVTAGSLLLARVAVGLYGFLVVAWGVTALGTLRNSWCGKLFLPASASVSAAAGSEPATPAPGAAAVAGSGF